MVYNGGHFDRCFGVSGAGAFKDDPTERFVDYVMEWEPDGVSYWMDGKFMQRFTKDQVHEPRVHRSPLPLSATFLIWQLVMYLSGQNRPILIPEMPLFMTYNIALVRKGMDLSHGGEGLTDQTNFDPKDGKWKGMHMDVECAPPASTRLPVPTPWGGLNPPTTAPPRHRYFRVYQSDSQGETRGLNPPITYETRKKLLANRVTCNLIPELRCLVKNSTEAGQKKLAQMACDKLRAIGDEYCDTIHYVCSLNNAGNKHGPYASRSRFTYDLGAFYL